MKRARILLLIGTVAAITAISLLVKSRTKTCLSNARVSACYPKNVDGTLVSADPLEIIIPGKYGLTERQLSEYSRIYGSGIQDYESFMRSDYQRRGVEWKDGYTVRDMGGHTVYFLNVRNESSVTLRQGVIYGTHSAFDITYNQADEVYVSRWVGMLELK